MNNRILVVDDEPANVLLRNLLHTRQLYTEPASAKEALEQRERRVRQLP